MIETTKREINLTCLDHPVPAEDAITGCLRAIREEFADINDTESGDYCERWSKAVLGERPIIVVSLLDGCEARTWVMDAHVDEVVHAAWYTTMAPPIGVAHSESITLPLAKIREMVNWLHYGQSATWLEDESEHWMPPEQREEERLDRKSAPEDTASAA